MRSSIRKEKRMKNLDRIVRTIDRIRDLFPNLSDIDAYYIVCSILSSFADENV